MLLRMGKNDEKMEHMKETRILELEDPTHNYLEIWNKSLDRMEADKVIGNT